MVNKEHLTMQYTTNATHDNLSTNAHSTQVEQSVANRDVKRLSNIRLSNKCSFSFSFVTDSIIEILR